MKKNNKKQNLKKITFKLRKNKKNASEKQYTLEYFRKLLLRNFSIVFMLIFLIVSSFTANIMYDYLYSLESKVAKNTGTAESNSDELSIEKMQDQEFDFEKFKEVIIKIEERADLFIVDLEDSENIFK